jgi:hypothetical protein
MREEDNEDRVDKIMINGEVVSMKDFAYVIMKRMNDDVVGKHVDKLLSERGDLLSSFFELLKNLMVDYYIGKVFESRRSGDDLIDADGKVVNDMDEGLKRIMFNYNNDFIVSSRIEYLGRVYGNLEDRDKMVAKEFIRSLLRSIEEND